MVCFKSLILKMFKMIELMWFCLLLTVAVFTVGVSTQGLMFGRQTPSIEILRQLFFPAFWKTTTSVYTLRSIVWFCKLFFNCIDCIKMYKYSILVLSFRVHSIDRQVHAGYSRKHVWFVSGSRRRHSHHNNLHILSAGLQRSITQHSDCDFQVKIDFEIN
jgi:hypothetical protein